MESLPLFSNSGDYPMSTDSSHLELDMPSADAVEISEIITSTLKGVDCSDVPSMDMEHLSINDEDFNELVRERKKSGDLEKDVDNSTNTTDFSRQEDGNISRDEKSHGKESKEKDVATLRNDVSNEETDLRNDDHKNEASDCMMAAKLPDTNDYLDDINEIITSPEHTTDHVHFTSSPDLLPDVGSNSEPIRNDGQGAVKAKVLSRELELQEMIGSPVMEENVSEKLSEGSKDMKSPAGRDRKDDEYNERQKIVGREDCGIPKQPEEHTRQKANGSPGEMVQLPELADGSGKDFGESARRSGSEPISLIGLQERGISGHKSVKSSNFQARPILPKTTLPVLAKTESVVTRKYPVRIHHTSGTDGNTLCLEVCPDSSLSIPSVVHEVMNQTSHAQERKIDIDGPASHISHKTQQQQTALQAPLQSWQAVNGLQQNIPIQAPNTMHATQSGQFGHIFSINSSAGMLGNNNNSVISSASNENINDFQMVSNANPPYGEDLILADRHALEKLGVPYKCISSPHQRVVQAMKVSQGNDYGVPVQTSVIENAQPNSYVINQPFQQVNLRAAQEPIQIATQQPTQRYIMQSTVQQQILQPSQQTAFAIPDQFLLDSNTNPNVIRQEPNIHSQSNLNHVNDNALKMKSSMNLSNLKFSHIQQTSNSDSLTALKQQRTNIQIQQPSVNVHGLPCPSYSESVGNRALSSSNLATQNVFVNQKLVRTPVSLSSQTALSCVNQMGNPQAIASCQSMLVTQIPVPQNQEMSEICLQPGQRDQLRKTLNNKSKPKRLKNHLGDRKTGSTVKSSTSKSTIYNPTSSHLDDTFQFSAVPENFLEYPKSSNDLSDDLNQEIEKRKERLQYQNDGLLQSGIINDLVGKCINHSPQNTHGGQMGPAVSSQPGVEKVENSIRLSGDLDLDLTQYLGGSSLDKASNGIHSGSFEKYLNIPAGIGQVSSSGVKEKKSSSSTLPTEVGHVDILAWRQQAFDTGLSGFANHSFTPEASIPGACANVEKMNVSRDHLSFSFSSGGDCAMESVSLENCYGMNVSAIQDTNGLANNVTSKASVVHHNIPSDFESLIDHHRQETPDQSHCDRLNLQGKKQKHPSQLSRNIGMQGSKSSPLIIPTAGLPNSGSVPVSNNVLNHSKGSDVSMQPEGNLNDLSVHSERKTYNEFSSNANITGNAHDKTLVYTDKFVDFNNRSTPKSSKSKSKQGESSQRNRNRHRQGQPVEFVADWVNNVNRDWPMPPSGQESLHEDLQGHDLPNHKQSHQTHHNHLPQQRREILQHQSLAKGVTQQNYHQQYQQQNQHPHHYNSLYSNSMNTPLPQPYSSTNNVYVKTRTQPPLSSSSSAPFSPNTPSVPAVSQHQLNIYSHSKLVPRGSSNHQSNIPKSDSHKISSKNQTPGNNQEHMLDIDLPGAVKTSANSPRKSSELAPVTPSLHNPSRTVPQSGKAATSNSADVEVIVSPSDDSGSYVYPQKEPTSMEYVLGDDSDLHSWGSDASSMDAKRRWFESLGIDDEEDTPLHYLCDMPQSDDILKKIRSNKNLKKVIDHMNSRQETALFVAVVKQNPHIVKFLVQNGANVNIVCKSDAKKYQRASPEYQTALHEAVETGNKAIIKILLNVSDVNTDSRRQVSYLTPLMLALSCRIPSESDRMEIVTMLLRREASLESQDAEGKTPLMYMVISGNVQLVRLILDRVGVQAARSLVTAVTKKKQMTCLHYVAQLKDRRIESAKKKDLLRLLIEHGADPDKLNTDKQSPRHWASIEIFEVMSRLKTMTDGDSAHASPRTTEELAAVS